MIEIGNAPQGATPCLDRAAGGFAWWYADLVNPAGDGATLIWSYGLPFLPGYAAAARKGRAERPRARPSINIVTYQAGRPSVYLLQEYSEEAADGAAAEFDQRIGECRFVRTVENGVLRLHAEMDCALPGTPERLTGHFRVEGTARGDDASAYAGEAPHLWTPLSGPATGEVCLHVGGRVVAEVRGRAYHDRNMGGRSLHTLGIRHWIWARLPFRDRERIVYLLWPADGGAPRAIGLEIREDGATEHLAPLDLELAGRRWAPIGPRLPAAIELLRDGRRWLSLRVHQPADVGPFYLRFLCGAEDAGGEQVLGWGEIVRPDRVDLALHRPFVRMRVHRIAASNSPWVPLFSGPREGRVRRLLRHWAAGRT